MPLNSELMPVFFIGHGNPLNAIETNPFTKSLEKMGLNLNRKPEAILIVSAHWLTDDTYVSMNKKPETIYDFYGFPDELYRVKYPAPGAPVYAGEVMKLVPQVKEDSEWGLDHGAWSILRHLFPKADIPCFQLSIDFYKPMQYHFDLAGKLKPLRNKGVLIIGSGNIVHNLRMIYMKEDPAPYGWAVEFDKWVEDKIGKRDFNALIQYKKAGRAAQMAVPTVDHYVPLLYSLALAEPDEGIEFTYEEVFSSLSMRCLRIG